MTKQFKLKAVDESRLLSLDKETMIVGRDAGCDIVIKHGLPSRQHAKIVIDNETVTVEDLSSTNGTHVNNKKINAATVLMPGDVVKFDANVFCLLAQDDMSATVMLDKLPPLDSDSDESTIIIRDGFSQGNETVMRQSYPMPPGWADYEQDKHLTADSVKKPSKELTDYLISDKLQEKQALAAAALVVVSGNHKSRVVGLVVKKESHKWNIGREESSHLPISDISISSRHAVLIYQRGVWELRDDDSTNGIKVNGQKQNTARLNDEDSITLGNVEVVFRLLK